MRALHTVSGILVAVVLLVAGFSGAQTQSGSQPDRPVDRLLGLGLGFSDKDLRALDRGSAVIRSLDTPVRQEVAHVGVVYLDASPEEFVEQFRDIVRFEAGPGVPSIGRFGVPPRLEDLDSLVLPLEDLEALSRCRPRDCDVKLPAAAMQRFRTDVDWLAADAAAQASQVAREIIFGLVLAYQVAGNAALGRYEDGNTSLLVGEELGALLASDDPVATAVPELIAFLRDYPHGRPAGTEDFFYWTVVDFGLKPTIRVNHVTIYPLDAMSPSGATHAIAIKQIYASHYFHTTLELRLVGTHERYGAWLMSLTRSRNDGMTGFKGLFLRPIIKRRSRDGVRRYLEHVRSQVGQVRREQQSTASRTTSS